jgi:predicted  nucleic acid-binding Zn-ribbon protein
MTQPVPPAGSPAPQIHPWYTAAAKTIIMNDLLDLQARPGSGLTAKDLDQRIAELYDGNERVAGVRAQGAPGGPPRAASAPAARGPGNGGAPAQAPEPEEWLAEFVRAMEQIIRKLDPRQNQRASPGAASAGQADGAAPIAPQPQPQPQPAQGQGQGRVPTGVPGAAGQGPAGELADWERRELTELARAVSAVLAQHPALGDLYRQRQLGRAGQMVEYGRQLGAVPGAVAGAGTQQGQGPRVPGGPVPTGTPGQRASVPASPRPPTGSPGPAAGAPAGRQPEPRPVVGAEGAAGSQPLTGEAQARFRNAEAKLLAARLKLKEDQAKLFEGQVKLEERGAELGSAEARLKEGQDELGANRAELKSAQDELKKGRDELVSGQDELKTGQDELRTGQDDLEKARTRLEADRAELQKAQEALEEGRRALAEDGAALNRERLQLDGVKLQVEGAQLALRDAIAELEGAAKDLGALPEDAQAGFSEQMAQAKTFLKESDTAMEQLGQKQAEAEPNAQKGPEPNAQVEAGEDLHAVAPGGVQAGQQEQDRSWIEEESKAREWTSEEWAALAGGADAAVKQADTGKPGASAGAPAAPQQDSLERLNNALASDPPKPTEVRAAAAATELPSNNPYRKDALSQSANRNPYATSAALAVTETNPFRNGVAASIPRTPVPVPATPHSTSGRSQ